MKATSEESFSVLEGNGGCTSEQPGRPPKVTQQEAAFLLERGPYIARLAAQRKLLEFALRFQVPDGHEGPKLPEYVFSEIEERIGLRADELAEFERESQPNDAGTEPVYETRVKKARAADPELESRSQKCTRRNIGERATTHAGAGELLLLTGDEETANWQARGLCAQTDPESFFPEKGGSTKEAKKTCLSCEVREKCLQHALDNDERFGVWGGLSERERRKLQRQRAV